MLTPKIGHITHNFFILKINELNQNKIFEFLKNITDPLSCELPKMVDIPFILYTFKVSFDYQLKKMWIDSFFKHI